MRLHHRHRDKQQDGNHQGADQDFLGTHPVPQFSQSRGAQQRRHAGYGGNQPADERNIADVTRQVANVQRQNRGNRPGSYLDNHCRHEQAQHQSGIFK